MYAEEIKLYGLLNEFDGICNSAEVKYFLIEHELLCQFRKKRDYSCEIDVCMFMSDFQVIQETLSTQENREIESFETNQDMPGCYYRYVNSGTLAYELDYHAVRKAHGLAINIHILRTNDAASEKLADEESIMEQRIEGLSYDSDVNQERLGNVKFKKLGFSQNIKRLTKTAFAANEMERTTLKLPGKKMMVFPEEFWQKSVRRIFDGHRFSTVKDVAGYLEISYGMGWEEIPLDSVKNSYFIITDVQVPYKQFIDKLNASGDFDDEFWSRRKSYRKNVDEDFNERSDSEKKHWKILFFTQSLFRLWKRYMPLKDDILKLAENRRMDELEFILQAYDSEVKEYFQEGFVLCFDVDIWQIYLECLRLRGESNLASQLESQMDLESFEPLNYDKMMDYLDAAKGKLNGDLYLRG